jgi:hypothetical protein
MVAFLEKHFQFTTSLSMDECVTRLEAKSKRGSGWLASKRDILVHVYNDANEKKFDLDRDVGKSLYAEVQGQLLKKCEWLGSSKGIRTYPFQYFHVYNLLLFHGMFRRVCLQTYSATRYLLVLSWYHGIGIFVSDDQKSK